MNETKQFAKLFDDPDYGQILVMIANSEIMDYKTSICFMVRREDFPNEVHIPYETNEKAYEAFLKVDYEQARKEAEMLSRGFDNYEQSPKEVKLESANQTDENYNPNAMWQEGDYALRKLYHESKKPLVVVYTSPTCPPCHSVKPQIRRVIDELNGLVQAVEINTEENQELIKEAGVNSTPTVQIFHLKEFKKQFVGVHQRSDYKQFLEDLIQEVSS